MNCVMQNKTMTPENRSARDLHTNVFAGAILRSQNPLHAKDSRNDSGQLENTHMQSPDPDKLRDVDPLFTEVYQRLKALASRARSRSGSPATLCTTELVHEAFMRMSDADYRHIHSAKFFAFAAQAMRHILIDAARRRTQPSRGGDQLRLLLDDPAVQAVQVDPEMALHLDQALIALEQERPRAAQIVELHFFAGLGLQQAADIVGITRRTADRDWRYARAFLAVYASD
jgi:RNA polymerase sigma factor (TIGR02999 family)